MCIHVHGCVFVELFIETGSVKVILKWPLAGPDKTAIFSECFEML